MQSDRRPRSLPHPSLCWWRQTSAGTWNPCPVTRPMSGGPLPSTHLQPMGLGPRAQGTKVRSGWCRKRPRQERVQGMSRRGVPSHWVQPSPPGLGCFLSVALV